MTCKPFERAGARPVHDIVLAALITAVFALLSLPAHWAFRIWAESSPVWTAYFVLGAVLSAYIVAVFLRVTRTLLAHAHDDGPCAAEDDREARRSQP